MPQIGKHRFKVIVILEVLRLMTEDTVVIFISLVNTYKRY